MGSDCSEEPLWEANITRVSSNFSRPEEWAVTIRVLRLSLMPIDQILALLIAERDRLNRAIEALQGPARRRGRPPKNPLTASMTATPALAKKRHGGMSATAKKAVSARMKAYWAAKRKAAPAKKS